MFALDYISNGKAVGLTDGEHIASPPNPKTTTTTTRARSNSMTSCVSSDGIKIKPPHTEGHIKWLTTV